MEIAERVGDVGEEIRKKRLRFLKTALNIYRSRALSVKAAVQFIESDVYVPNQVCTYDFLRRQVCGLQNEIAMIMAFQESAKVLHNTLTCSGLSDLTDPNVKSELQKTIQEFSFFSQSIMRLYQEGISEMEIIKSKQDYRAALMNYKENLDCLKQKQKQKEQLETTENTRRLQKAENQVKKINFIRQIKFVLIGRLAGNGEQFESLQQFRSPFKRNLTIDDFNESWDVGL